VTFRQRIIVAMLPLFALLVVLGGTGATLIYSLGSQVDQILRENYDSVIHMRDLNEALERIDSSFQFALAGREKESLPAVRHELEAVSGQPDPRAKQHHAAGRKGVGRRADQA